VKGHLDLLETLERKLLINDLIEAAIGMTGTFVALLEVILRIYFA